MKIFKCITVNRQFKRELILLSLLDLLVSISIFCFGYFLGGL